MTGPCCNPTSVTLLLLFVKVYLYISSYGYLRVSMSNVCGYLWKKEGSIGTLGAGITGPCDSLDVNV